MKKIYILIPIFTFLLYSLFLNYKDTSSIKSKIKTNEQTINTKKEKEDFIVFNDKLNKKKSETVNETVYIKNEEALLSFKIKEGKINEDILLAYSDRLEELDNKIITYIGASFDENLKFLHDSFNSHKMFSFEITDPFGNNIDFNSCLDYSTSNKNNLINEIIYNTESRSLYCKKGEDVLKITSIKTNEQYNLNYSVSNHASKYYFKGVFSDSDTHGVVVQTEKEDLFLFSKGNPIMGFSNLNLIKY